MNEVMWLNPPEAKRQDLHRRWPNIERYLFGMALVVVVLLQQRDDQLKSGLS